MSIVFDRAVEFYDQTRALPASLAGLVAKTLVERTKSTRGSEVLEIGIGTGRIGIPVVAEIGHLNGIDLSRPMMQALLKKDLPRFSEIDLAQANATSLPFPPEQFDLVYAVHVLHLIPEWREAVQEARRVLKEGGYFAVKSHRRFADSPTSLIRDQLRRFVEEFGINTERPGTRSEEEILFELSKWGRDAIVVDVAEWKDQVSARGLIQDIDRQVHSETWGIPRAVLDKVVPELRAWAVEKFGLLDRPIEIPESFRWLIAVNL